MNAPIQASGVKFSPQNASGWTYAIAALIGCTLALGLIFRQECVGAYLYLASDTLSSYVTGQVIEVNGGQLMP